MQYETDFVKLASCDIDTAVSLIYKRFQFGSPYVLLKSAEGEEQGNGVLGYLKGLLSSADQKLGVSDKINDIASKAGKNFSDAAQSNTYNSFKDLLSNPSVQAALIGGGIGGAAGLGSAALGKKKRYLGNALTGALLGAGVGGLGHYGLSSLHRSLNESDITPPKTPDGYTAEQQQALKARDEGMNAATSSMKNVDEAIKNKDVSGTADAGRNASRNLLEATKVHNGLAGVHLDKATGKYVEPPNLGWTDNTAKAYRKPTKLPEGVAEFDKPDSDRANDSLTKLVSHAWDRISGKEAPPSNPLANTANLKQLADPANPRIAGLAGALSGGPLSGLALAQQPLFKQLETANDNNARVPVKGVDAPSPTLSEDMESSPGFQGAAKGMAGMYGFRRGLDAYKGGRVGWNVDIGKPNAALKPFIRGGATALGGARGALAGLIPGGVGLEKAKETIGGRYDPALWGARDRAMAQARATPASEALPVKGAKPKNMDLVGLAKAKGSDMKSAPQFFAGNLGAEKGQSYLANEGLLPKLKSWAWKGGVPYGAAGGIGYFANMNNNARDKQIHQAILDGSSTPKPNVGRMVDMITGGHKPEAPTLNPSVGMSEAQKDMQSSLPGGK